MKIAHVLNNFLPSHVAGTEVYALNLGNELFKKGHEIIFIVPNYHQTNNEEYLVQDMRVIKYAEPSVVDKALKMGKRKPDGLKNFAEVLREEKPDVVHFHELAGSNGIGLYHVQASKRLDFKTVMTFHLGRYTATYDSLSYPDDVFDIRRGSINFYTNKGISKRKALFLYNFSRMISFLNPFMWSLGKMGTALSIPGLVKKKRDDFFTLMKIIDRGVVITKWYKELLEKHGVEKRKLQFIEQGINCNSKALVNQVNKTEAIQFVFVGRISQFKGVRDMVRVFSKLEIENVHLDIYGDSGEDECYILECKSLAKGKQNINFKGRLDPDKVLSTLSQCDVLILPSTFSEMSPLVIREAFAAGIPVLASESMGAREQIQEGENGWLFRMNDWGDLKEKLEWLIAHPEKIKEAHYFQPVRTFREVANEYEALYNEISKTSRS